MPATRTIPTTIQPQGVDDVEAPDGVATAIVVEVDAAIEVVVAGPRSAVPRSWGRRRRGRGRRYPGRGGGRRRQRRRACWSALTEMGSSYSACLPAGSSTPNHHMRSASAQPPRPGGGQARSDAWMSTTRVAREMRGRRARCTHFRSGPATSFCLSLVADESMTADDVERHDNGRCLAPSFRGRIASSRTKATAFSRTAPQGRATG